MFDIAPARYLEEVYKGFTIRRYRNEFGEPAWYIVDMEEHCGPEGFPSVYAARYAVDNMEAMV